MEHSRRLDDEYSVIQEEYPSALQLGGVGDNSREPKFRLRRTRSSKVSEETLTWHNQFRAYS